MNNSLRRFNTINKVFLFVFLGTLVLGFILLALCNQAHSGATGYDGTDFSSVDECMSYGYAASECTSYTNWYFDATGMTFTGSILSFGLSGASLVMFALSSMLVQTSKSIIEGLGGNLNK